jgi:hypothetical protein
VGYFISSIGFFFLVYYRTFWLVYQILRNLELGRLLKITISMWGWNDTWERRGELWAKDRDKMRWHWELKKPIEEHHGEHVGIGRKHDENPKKFLSPPPPFPHPSQKRNAYSIPRHGSHQFLFASTNTPSTKHTLLIKYLCLIISITFKKK